MRRACGFTLLELLLAVALSLLLALLAYGGLRLAIQSWAGVDRQLQRGEEHHLSHMLLRRLLQGVEAERLRSPEGELLLAFRGEVDGLLFCAELPGLGEPGQRYWVQLSQEPTTIADGQRWRLLLRSRRFDESLLLDWDQLRAELIEQEQPEVLLEDLAQPLRFTYQERPADSEARWLEEWHEQAELPQLLRVDAANPQLPVAVELTVAPQEVRYAIVRAR